MHTLHVAHSGSCRHDVYSYLSDFAYICIHSEIFTEHQLSVLDTILVGIQGQVKQMDYCLHVVWSLVWKTNVKQITTQIRVKFANVLQGLDERNMAS